MIQCVFRALSIALVCSLLAPERALAAEEADLVREVFTSYRTAILAGDGEKASGLLSQTTYAYYDEMRTLALYGAEETVRAQPLVNQLQVLLFRTRIPSEQLQAFTPQGLIAHAVDQGWIGRQGVQRVQPGAVETEGEAAVLSVKIDDQDAGPLFRFNREDGGWRLDLVPTTQASNAALRMAAESQRMTEADFIGVMMESVLGRKLAADDWKPPLARPNP